MYTMNCGNTYLIPTSIVTWTHFLFLAWMIVYIVFVISPLPALLHIFAEYILETFQYHYVILCGFYSILL